MHSKDRLAAELEKIGLPEMAAKASQGYYHDYMSPLEMPASQLASDLADVGTVKALSLRLRHLDGEFDATKAESDQWANSAEGKEAFRRLIRDGGRK